MADNLLDKASILLTPTAYNDGRMLSVKPNENLYGTEEVTNGDFATDSDWTKGTGWSISSGTANANSASSSYFYQNINELGVGKTYKVTYTITSYTSGSVVAGIGDLLGNRGVTRNAIGTYTDTITFVNNTANSYFGFFATSSFIGSIDNVSVVEDLSGDFTFSRSSAATRVNAQGLVENVQIISSELVSNGNFSQIGTEEVSNGSFSQEGSEEIVNGSFDTDSNWVKQTGWSIANGLASSDGSQSLPESIYQNGVTVVGKIYKITYTIVSRTSGSVRPMAGTLGGTYQSTPNTYIEYLTATGNVSIGIQANADFVGSIDNVSVKEVGQDWTLGTGWSIGEDKASRTAQSGSTSMYQSVSFTANKSYKITYDLDISAGSFLLRIGGGALIDTSARTTSGTYTEYIVANSGNNVLNLRAVDGNFIGSITNISVKEVGQDWSLVGTAAIGNNLATINSPSGENAEIYQSSVLTIGRKYKLECILNKTSGDTQFVNGGTFILDNGSNIIEFIATDTRVYFKRGAGSVISSITNISVKEITDDTDLPRINYEGFSYQDSLGSELVVNGGFDTDSDWNNSVGNDWQIVNGKLILTTTSPNNINQGIGLVQNKFYKIVFTISNTTLGGVRIRLGTGSFTSTYTDGTHTLYLQQTTTNDAFRFYANSSGVFNGSIDNVSVKEVLGQEVVPDSGCGSWLLEPQSTNLITYSEDFSQSAWTKTAAIVETASITLPDGLSNGYKLFANTTATSHRIEQYPFPTATLGQDYTLSLFVKSAGSNFIQIASSTGLPVKYQNFNISTGVKASGDISGSSITNFGNGWYRISVTETTIGTNARYLIIPILSDVSRNAPFAGNAEEDGVYIYGAQLEQQSYATSYIPTNGATNTRLQDIANNSGNSTLINSTEGVLYAEIAALSSPVDSPKNITISDGTVNNYVRIEYYQDGRVYGNVYDGTSVAANFVVNQLNFNKVAIQYSSSGSKLYVNGTGVDFASKIFTSNTLNTIQFSSAAADSNYFYGKNKALAVYKEALTDTNLRSLTYPNPVATTFDLDFDTIAEQFTFTRGSEATFVNAQGLIESTASNDAPRIDYSTGAKAFLLENQSTNRMPNSEDGSTWTLNNTTLSSLNGGLNKKYYQITSLGNTGRFDVVQNNWVNLTAGTYTASVFAKKGTCDEIILTTRANFGFQNHYSAFDLTNGLVTANASGVVGSIKPYSDGWYRCSITFTNTGGFTDSASLAFGFNFNSSSTDTLFVASPQSEIGSYATSYIPTSGASATRNQELCINATPEINSEEGVLYADIAALSATGNNSNITLSDGTGNNRIYIYYLVDNSISVIYNINSTGASLNNFSLANITNQTKIAVRWGNSNVSVWINGTSVLSNTTSNFLPNTLNVLNFSKPAGSGNFFGNTKDLKVYPKALADVQLEDLTTI